jgi:sulfur-carrier protein adenylyltransferase/sulfurtransferase
MSLFQTAAPNPAGHRDVTTAQVVLPPLGYRIIDVREPAEFQGELGHIPGASLVPMGGVMAQATAWKPDEELVLVCKSGGRSGQVAQALSRAGFAKVMNLVGGMLAWNAAQRPIEK